MKRVLAVLLLVATLTAGCGLKINMPTLSSVDGYGAVSVSGEVFR